MAESRNHRGSLGSAQLEDDLSVLPVEGRLYGKVIRMIQFAQGVHLLEYDIQLIVCRINFPEVEHAHIYEARLARLINTDNPETKDIGSGIDSEYGLGLSQSCRILCMA